MTTSTHIQLCDVTLDCSSSVVAEDVMDATSPDEIPAQQQMVKSRDDEEDVSDTKIHEYEELPPSSQSSRSCPVPAESGYLQVSVDHPTDDCRKGDNLMTTEHKINNFRRRDNPLYEKLPSSKLVTSSSSSSSLAPVVAGGSAQMTCLSVAMLISVLCAVSAIVISAFCISSLMTSRNVTSHVETYDAAAAIRNLTNDVSQLRLQLQELQQRQVSAINSSLIDLTTRVDDFNTKSRNNSCIHRVIVAGTPLTRDVTVAGPLNTTTWGCTLSGCPQWSLSGVACSTVNGLTTLLRYDAVNAPSSYTCVCAGNSASSSMADSRYCELHYWTCPVINLSI